MGSSRSCTTAKQQLVCTRTHQEDEGGLSLRSYRASRVSVISRFPGLNDSGTSRISSDTALTPTPTPTPTPRPNSEGAGRGGQWAGRRRPRPLRYFEAGVSCTGRRAVSDPKPELSEESIWVSVLLSRGAPSPAYQPLPPPGQGSRRPARLRVEATQRPRARVSGAGRPQGEAKDRLLAPGNFRAHLIKPELKESPAASGSEGGTHSTDEETEAILLGSGPVQGRI